MAGRYAPCLRVSALSVVSPVGREIRGLERFAHPPFVAARISIARLWAIRKSEGRMRSVATLFEHHHPRAHFVSSHGRPPVSDAGMPARQMPLNRVVRVKSKRVMGLAGSLHKRSRARSLPAKTCS